MKIAFGIEILEQAFSDIENAKIWYNKRLAGLGDALAAEVKKGIEIISSSPLMFPKAYRNLRKYVCSKFPFRIFYQLNRKLQKIIIIGVLHDKQSIRNITRRKSI